MIGAKDNIYENVIHHLQEETMTCVLLRQHVSIERARNNTLLYLISRGGRLLIFQQFATQYGPYSIPPCY